jgi:hypothetical protein
MRGTAVEARLLAALELESELSGNHRLIPNRRQRFADEFLVRERTVRFSGIEERHTAIERRADQRDAGRLVDGGPVTEA